MIKTKTVLSLVQFFKYIMNYNLGEWTSHLWYMGALVCLYCFFPFIKYVYDNKRDIFYYFMVMIFMFTFFNKIIGYSLCLFWDLFFGKEIVIGTSFNIFGMFNPVKGIYAYTFVYFCLGGLAYEMIEKIKQIKTRTRNLISITILMVSSVLFSLLGIYFSKKMNNYWDFARDGYETVFVIINTFACFVLSLSFNKEIKLIREISKNTLGIYFMQYILIQLTRGFVKQIDIFCTLSGNVVYSVVIVLSCTMIACLLKKIPVLKYLVQF